MKTLRNIATLLFIFSLAAGGTWLVIQNIKNKDCTEAMATMGGVQVCMEKPGCFYDADDVVAAKRSFMYHMAHCKSKPA